MTLNRRLILGAGASFLVAPAIVRAQSLMPISLGFLSSVCLIEVYGPRRKATPDEMLRELGVVFGSFRRTSVIHPDDVGADHLYPTGPHRVATIGRPYWHMAPQ